MISIPENSSLFDQVLSPNLTIFHSVSNCPIIPL
uniref:Uncharacterized protein n=1 Tax=viral metagenome TaxID=1070528 RepID=A0A6C0BKX2_9ZZZZ